MASQGRILLTGAIAVSEIELIRDDPSVPSVVTDTRRRIEGDDLADARRGVVDRQHGGRAPGRRSRDREQAERDRPPRRREAHARSKG